MACKESTPRPSRVTGEVSYQHQQIVESPAIEYMGQPKW